MKRKIVTLLTGLVLSFSLLSFPVYAADEPVPPVQPAELTEESVQNYNSEVDVYNTQVDEYNNQIDVTYNQELTEYNQTLEYNEQETQRVAQENAQIEQDVKTHNAEEDAKVEQNKQDLEQYQKDLEKYEEDLKDPQYLADKKNENTILNAGYGSVEEYNMAVFKAPDTIESGEFEDICKNQAVDRRIVREENASLKGIKASSTIEVDKAKEPAVADEDESPTSYTVIAIHHFLDRYGTEVKTETFENIVNINDTITVKSIAYDNAATSTVLNSDKYAVFYMYINESLLSYYWYESFAYSEYTALKNKNDFIHTTDKYGDFYTYSLKNGKKYYSDSYYFSAEYYYFPYLTINKPIEPIKPDEVEEYSPDYWEIIYVTPNYKDVIEPVKGEYLNKLDYINYTPEQEEIRPREPAQSPHGTTQIAAQPAPAFFTTSLPTRQINNITLPLSADELPIDELVSIQEDEVPLANIEKEDPISYWALLNLLLTIYIAIQTIILLILYFIKNKKKQNNVNTQTISQRVFTKRIVSIFLTITAVIMFILTEDMSLPMTIVDKYTIIMALLACIEVLITIFWKRKETVEKLNPEGE